MTGSKLLHRHLGRDSEHRQALLRNLVSSLIQHESISTTWHKAKEASRVAEKLITLGKRNTNAAMNKAKGMVYEPDKIIPKVFNDLRERYAERPGGYTRVLRIEPLKEDQAPSAILELVDGPKDMRFAMTARTVARLRASGKHELNDITAMNKHKVTQFRKNGEKEFNRMVLKFENLFKIGDNGIEEPKVQRVYPEVKKSR